MKRVGIICALALVGPAGLGFAATIRPGGDPAPERVIWADPFDWYNQWSYDNNQIWQGGPTPAGVAGGAYPTKAPSDGCDTTRQEFPALHELARAQWLSNDCGYITSPRGVSAEPGVFDAPMDPNCGGSGEIATTRGQLGHLNYTWGMGGSFHSMPQFRHNLLGRIQDIAAARNEGFKNAINGTDQNPLIVIFYMNPGMTGSGIFDNAYVELSYGDDTAPTDYIWRGNPTAPPKGTTDPEYCPQGPYPIICQQTRVINSSVSEDGSDLTYLNAHCPALVPAYDPETGTGKTWRSLAFGLLAIGDKDPCGLAESGADAHKPTSDHWWAFDGNKWQQFRSGRFTALDKSVWPLPFPYDPYMQQGNGGGDDFAIGLGDTRVVLKITTDVMYVYATNEKSNQTWGATVPRVYKGAFDTIRIGVGPGCELDPATGECKAEGTPKQCLTYSANTTTGYERVYMDSISIFDGILEEVTEEGACCNRDDGSCSIVLREACDALPNSRFDGPNTFCGQFRCCPDQYGDTDADGDVDMDDFAVLQTCFTAAGAVNSSNPDCICLDSEADGDVDVTDYTRFSICASGAETPASVNCKTQWPQ